MLVSSLLLLFVHHFQPFWNIKCKEGYKPKGKSVFWEWTAAGSEGEGEGEGKGVL